MSVPVLGVEVLGDVAEAHRRVSRVLQQLLVSNKQNCNAKNAI